jgi:hypothetical protein
VAETILGKGDLAPRKTIGSAQLNYLISLFEINKWGKIECELQVLSQPWGEAAITLLLKSYMLPALSLSQRKYWETLWKGNLSDFFRKLSEQQLVENLIHIGYVEGVDFWREQERLCLDPALQQKLLRFE